MTIDQIIERELLGLRAVSIPFVGTLSVGRLSARFVDGVGSPIIPPSGRLILSPDYIDQRSIISIIACQLCADDTDQATLLYNDWLSTSSVAEQMVIQGVCSVDLNHFTLSVDEHFAALLCPAGIDPVSIGRTAPVVTSAPIKTRKQGTAQRNAPITIALLIVILAAIYIVYYLFFKDSIAL